MGAAKRRIHRSQCFTIFTGTGSFARMEQLRDPQYVPHVMRYYSGGSLFCIMVCRTKWNGCIRTSIEVFKLCCRSKLVSGTRKMERKRLYTIRRRLYLFDWNKDGQVNHVGIVVNVANGRVNTIEGNTSNMVAIVIVGYGYI